MAEIRIADADKERAASVLKFHFRAGRLDAEEYSDRLAALYSVKTFDELYLLTSDLPEHGGPHPILRDAGSTTTLPGRALPSGEAAFGGLGHKPGKAPKMGSRPWTLAVAIASYIAINGALVLVWALGSVRSFWPAWPIALWGLFIAAGGFVRSRISNKWPR